MSAWQRQSQSGRIPAVVLVVDPEETIRNLLCQTLKRSGYRVCAVECLEKAADLCGLFEFDLIITGSFAQPPCDFWSALLELRRIADGIPIIINSAYGAEYFEGYRERGFDEFIEKPFDLHELLDRVRLLAEPRPEQGETPVGGCAGRSDCAGITETC